MAPCLKLAFKTFKKNISSTHISSKKHRRSLTGLVLTSGPLSMNLLPGLPRTGSLFVPLIGVRAGLGPEAAPSPRLPARPAFR